MRPENRKAVALANSAKTYLPWRKFRHRMGSLSRKEVEDLWVLAKLQRQASRRYLPFQGTSGRPFSLVEDPSQKKALWRIDTRQGILAEDLHRSAEDGDGWALYLPKVMDQEAYYSSRIEGAVTTRRKAKEMLRENRAPRDKAEQMILNNFRTLQRIQEAWKDEPLTPERLLEIQAAITENTLDNPEDSGVFRRDDEVQVLDRNTGELVHQPPSFEQLPARMEALCHFANHEESEEEGFVHPLVRAAVLHFQLTYDHPFGDGNGRTARALFVWSLLRRKEYHWIRFVSISRGIHASRESYYQSFQDVEEDELDLTYSVNYQLRVLEQEIRRMAAALREGRELQAKSQKGFKLKQRLNSRQVRILHSALKHETAEFTQSGHAVYHDITPMTANRDLNGMVTLGLLKRTRRSRTWIYQATAKLLNLER